MYHTGKHLSHRKPSSRACTTGLGFSETRGAEGSRGECGPHTPTPLLSNRVSVDTTSSIVVLLAHSCQVCVWGWVAFKPGGPQGRQCVAFVGSMKFACHFFHIQSVSFFWFVSLTGHGVSHGHHLRTQGGLEASICLSQLCGGRRSRGRSLGKAITLAKPSGE